MAGTTSTVHYSSLHITTSLAAPPMYTTRPNAVTTRYCCRQNTWSYCLLLMLETTRLINPSSKRKLPYPNPLRAGLLGFCGRCKKAEDHKPASGKVHGGNCAAVIRDSKVRNNRKQPTVTIIDVWILFCPAPLPNICSAQALGRRPTSEAASEAVRVEVGFVAFRDCVLRQMSRLAEISTKIPGNDGSDLPIS